MLSFENAILKKYWPADDKGEEDQVIHQAILQVEAEVSNSRQVAELFNNMVRGLVKITFKDPVTGETYELPAVTIKPFNIKQKKIKIGKGDDTDIVKTEFATMSLVTRIQDDDGGAILADLYRFFNIQLEMDIDEFTLKMHNESQGEPQSAPERKAQ